MRDLEEGNRLDEPLLSDEDITEEEEPNEDLPSFFKIVSIGKPELPVLMIATLCMLYNQVSQLILPQILGNAYDALIDPAIETKMPHINHLMILVLLLHVSGTIAGMFRNGLMSIVGERIVARLRTTLYSNILRQEIAFFDATPSGELISRLGSDTTVVKQAISQSWAEVLLGFIKLVAAIALMFWISPRLAGVTIASCFVVFAFCLPFGKAIGKLSKAYQDVLGEAQNYPTETFGAMRTVQGFAAEDRETQRYTSKIGIPAWCPSRSERSTFRLGYDRSIISSGFYTMIFGGGFAAMYVTLWYGFHLVNAGYISLGQLTAFQSYIFQIGGILAHMSSSITKVLEARGASKRLFDLLDREPKILVKSQENNTNSTTTTTTSPLKGDIEFNNVNFRYPSRPQIPVLENFNLKIPRNSTTALVGSSGAGKSTVVSLVERFYDVNRGDIKIDNVDIRTMDLKWMRRQIGYVQQEPSLFGLTIRENVLYGLDHRDDDLVVGDYDEEIKQACIKANAWEFISKWPEGLDTMVGERGVTLSGGQKQRIAIARAILLNPCILLLDEATSALDAESEHLVQEAIDTASQGRTVLIVAHRLSTIQKANQIVVMKDRRIQDVGTHDELMETSEIYQNLISRQSMPDNSHHG